MANAKRKLRVLRGGEEALIQAQISADSDDFEASDGQLAAGKSFAEALPGLAATAARSRGRPRVENPKVLISLRLDPNVVAKFKATGRGWQQRVNDALKRAKV